MDTFAIQSSLTDNSTAIIHLIESYLLTITPAIDLFKSLYQSSLMPLRFIRSTNQTSANKASTINMRPMIFGVRTDWLRIIPVADTQSRATIVISAFFISNYLVAQSRSYLFLQNDKPQGHRFGVPWRHMFGLYRL
jgi:hypothetical protein